MIENGFCPCGNSGILGQNCPLCGKPWSPRLKRDFKFIKDQNYDPVEDAGSVRFLDELEDIPNDFVEIIHSLRRIDVQATNFWRFTPYDEMVRKSEPYESKGVLFLASHPIE